MNSNVVVREMQFADLQAVFHLGDKVFTVDNWPVLYRTWDEYEVTERFISDSEFCLVAELEGKLAGFIVGTMIRKHGSPWVYGYILWMCVRPSKRKKGVGRELIKELIRKYKQKGVNILMVDTSPENKKALSFFRKNGFEREEPHLYLFKNLTRRK